MQDEAGNYCLHVVLDAEQNVFDFNSAINVWFLR